MVWRKINTRVQSSGAGGQNKDNIRNRGAITPKGVKESKECTGVWTSQRIATCKKSLDPKNTWTEELRGWGADCPWHPVAQWTADSATTEVLAPVISG